ncbi:unnamed protein product [Linum trigynum]|uniref:Uncharacterized protein n=1 Tax=Linum trigynum TaxID=586398 RepID=A0AAV2DBR1_9ROSI
MQGGEDGTCKAMQGTTMTTATEDQPAATGDRPWIWRMKKGRRLRPLRFFPLCSSRQPPRMKKDGMATKTDDRFTAAACNDPFSFLAFFCWISMADDSD